MGVGQRKLAPLWALALALACAQHTGHAQGGSSESSYGSYLDLPAIPQGPSGGSLRGVTVVPPLRTIPVVRAPDPVHNGRVCSTWGDFHYKTFDGAVFRFPGLCNYVFSAHCGGAYEDFNVQLRRGRQDGAVAPSRVIMKLEGLVVELTNHSVLVSGRPVQLPFSQSGVLIERSSGSLKVVAKLGLVFMWNQDDSLLLELDSKFANQTCGLCGDFNGIPASSEFLSHNTRLTPVEFGNLQKLDGPMEQCQDPAPETKRNCSTAPGVCEEVLGGELFASCVELVDVNSYVEACRQDLCLCDSAHHASCICQTLAEYARQCAHAGGLPLDWRGPDLCPLTCPHDMEYHECRSPCADTCSNPERSQLCEDHCVAGCFCPEGMVLDDIGQAGCVPVTQCACTYNGATYASGAKYSTDCTECTCSGGRWSCQDIPCPGTCSVLGGAHFSTFDERQYTVHGDCSYVLAKSCNSSTFTVLAELRRCGLTDSETCLKSVTLNLDGGQTVVVVKASGEVFVNHIYTQLPVSAANVTIFRPSTFFIIAHSNLGLQLDVQLVPTMQVAVRLEPEFQGRTCGLCGNFNRVQADDFRAISGVVEGTAAAFFNTFKTHASCPNVKNNFEDPCSLSVENEKFAQHWCSRLMDAQGPFAQCHSAVSPGTYHSNCLFDTCNCEKTEDCLCAALASYVRACAAKGVLLRGWRDGVCTKHTSSCPKSMTYHYHISTCQPTCRSRSEPDLTCSVSFVPVDGCACPEGTFLDDAGKCVEATSCPCYHGGSVVPNGESVHDSGAVCTCTQGTLTCIGGPAPAPVCDAPMVFFDCRNATAGATGAGCQKSCHTLDMECYSSQCVPGCVCPGGLVADGLGGCIAEKECPCVHNEASYGPGETIWTGCNTCTCENRKWRCSDEPCLATCAIYGDGHYLTFDGRRYSFSGDCEYTLLQDQCGGNVSAQDAFRVVTENVPCGTTGTTCSKAIKIFLGSYELKLSDGKVEVVEKGKGQEPPYSIRQMGIFLVLDTDAGLVLLWDRRTSLFLRLSPEFKGRVCGLCGNFDDNAMNDFTTRSQSVVGDALEFGNSWKFSPSCPDAPAPRDSCTANPYRKSWAQKQCSIIHSATFAACHAHVEPAEYYEACVQDACACDSGGDCECFCTAVAAYAQACHEVGVCVSWRSPDVCPLFCDFYNPEGQCEWHYQPCGAPCMRTCRNPSGECLHSVPGLEGCYPKCPSTAPIFDEDEMKCVATCPLPPPAPRCHIHGKSYRPGATVPSDENCHSCVCTESGVRCAYDAEACICTYHGRHYKPGTVIYHTTDGTGGCISARCGANGTIDRTVSACSPTTAVPPTTFSFSTTPSVVSSTRPPSTSPSPSPAQSTVPTGRSSSTVSTATSRSPRTVPSTASTPAPTDCGEQCLWSPWLDVSRPGRGSDSGDYDTLDNLRAHGYRVCQQPREVECRAEDAPEVALSLLGQRVQCTPAVGLTCHNREQVSGQCHNYQIRILCCSPLACHTSSFTVHPTTSSTTHTGLSPTTVTATSRATASKATTTPAPGTPSLSQTTAVTPSPTPGPTTAGTTPSRSSPTLETSTATSETASHKPSRVSCTQEICTWTPWIDGSYPGPGRDSGDFDTFQNLRAKGYKFCKTPSNVQCRAQFFPNTPLAELGQDVTCNREEGLICLNKNQLPPICYNYEIRIQCCQMVDTCRGGTTVPATSETTQPIQPETSTSAQTALTRAVPSPTTRHTAPTANTQAIGSRTTTRPHTGTPPGTSSTETGSSTSVRHTGTTSSPKTTTSAPTTTTSAPTTTASSTTTTSAHSTTTSAHTTTTSAPTTTTSAPTTATSVPSSSSTSTSRSKTTSKETGSSTSMTHTGTTPAPTTTTSATTTHPTSTSRTSTSSTETGRSTSVRHTGTTSSPTTTTSAPTTTTSAPSTTPSSTTTTSAHSTTTSAHTTTTSAPTTATSVPSSSSTSTSRSRATSKETGSSTSMTHTGTTPAPTTTTSATTTHPTSTSRTSTSSTETGRSTSVRHTGTTSSPTTTTSAPTTTTSAPSTTPSSTTTTSAHSTTTSAHTTTTSAPTTATSVPSSSSTSTSRSRATSKETGSSTSMTHTGTTPAPTTTTSATTTHPTSTSRTSTSSTETGRSTSVRHTGTTSSPTTTTSAPTTTTSAPTTTPSSTTTTSAHSTTTSAHTTTTSAPTTATSVPSSSSTSTSRSRATSKETGSSTSMTHTGTTPAPTTTTSATTTHPTSTSRTSTSSTETGRSTSTTHTRTSTSSSPTRSSTPVPITGTTSVPITSTRHPGTQMTRSQPTTSDCQPRCSWTKWFDVDFPAPGVHGGDKETYDNILRSGERICRRPEEITRLQCRAENHPDVSIEQLGQVVQCDPDVGLVCQNRDQDGAGRMCLNYEVRVLCCETPSGCPTHSPLTVPSTPRETVTSPTHTTSSMGTGSSTSSTRPSTTSAPTTSSTSKSGTSTSSTETGRSTSVRHTGTTSSPTTTTSAPTTTTSAPSTTPSSTTTTSAHSTTTSAHTTTTSAPTTATSVPSSSSTSTSRSRATSKETGSSTSMTHTGTTPAPTTTTSATTTHPTSTSRTSTSSMETGRSTSVRHTGTTSSPTTTTSAPTTTTSAPSTTPSSTTTTSAHSTTTSAHTTTTSAPTTTTSVPSSSSTSTSRSRATSKETGSSTSMTHTGTTPAPTTTTSATTTHPTSTSRTSTSSTETGRSTSVRHTGTTSSPTTTTSAPTTTTSAPTTTPSSTTTTSAHSTTTSAHTTTTSAPTTATSVPSSSSTSTSRSRATFKETGSSTSMTHTGTTPAPTTTTSATTTHPTSTSRTSTSSTETGRSTSTTHTRTSTSSSPTRSSTPVPITGTTSVPITSTRHPGTQMTRSQPTTSDCQPRCSWTKWFDVDFPAPGVHGGDKETYDNILRSGERICRRPEEITRLQCRAENHPDVSIEQLGQVVQCDPDVGLVCQNRDQDGAGRMCLNYEVRVLCCETPSGCPTHSPLTVPSTPRETVTSPTHTTSSMGTGSSTSSTRPSTTSAPTTSSTSKSGTSTSSTETGRSTSVRHTGTTSSPTTTTSAPTTTTSAPSTTPSSTTTTSAHSTTTSAHTTTTSAPTTATSVPSSSSTSTSRSRATSKETGSSTSMTHTGTTPAPTTTTSATTTHPTSTSRTSTSSTETGRSTSVRYTGTTSSPTTTTSAPTTTTSAPSTTPSSTTTTSAHSTTTSAHTTTTSAPTTATSVPSSSSTSTSRSRATSKETGSSTSMTHTGTTPAPTTTTSATTTHPTSTSRTSTSSTETGRSTSVRHTGTTSSPTTTTSAPTTTTSAPTTTPSSTTTTSAHSTTTSAHTTTTSAPTTATSVPSSSSTSTSRSRATSKETGSSTSMTHTGTTPAPTTTTSATTTHPTSTSRTSTSSTETGRSTSTTHTRTSTSSSPTRSSTPVPITGTTSVPITSTRHPGTQMTRSQPTTSDCQPRCSWTKWFDVDFPAPGVHGGDKETYDNILRSGERICRRPEEITRLQCRAENHPDVSIEQLGQVVQCDPDVGLVCQNRDQDGAGRMCLNYEVRVLCCETPSGCPTHSPLTVPSTPRETVTSPTHTTSSMGTGSSTSSTRPSTTSAPTTSSTSKSGTSTSSTETGRSTSVRHTGTTSSPTTTTSAPTTTTSAPSTTPSSTTTTSAHSTTTSAHTTTTSAPTTATSVPSSSSTSTSRSRATSKETGSSTSMTHTGTTPAPTTTTSATTTHPTSTSRTSTSSTETGRSTSVRHTGTTSSPTTTTSAPTTTTSAPSTTPSSTTTTSAHSTTTSAHTTTTSAPTTATSVPSSSSTSTSRSRATSKETGSSTSMTHTGTTPAPTTTTSATTTHPTSTSRTSTSSTETGRSTSVRHTGTTSSPTTTTSAPTTTTSAPTTTPSSTTTTSAHSTTTSAHTTTTSAPTTATSVPSSSSTSTSRSRATSKETGSSTSMTHTGTTPAPTTTTSATTTHPTSTSRTSTSSTETGRSTSTTHTRTSTSSSPTRSSTPVPITGTTSVPITSTRHPGTQMTRSQPTTSDCQPRCSWTKWFDVDFPAPGVHGGDKETYDNILRSGERICRRPEEITRLQCRAENHPDVSIEQLGQVVQCDPDVGLVCQNRDQDGAGRMCLNYEVRVLCCETPSGCPTHSPLTVPSTPRETVTSPTHTTSSMGTGSSTSSTRPSTTSAPTTSSTSKSGTSTSSTETGSSTSVRHTGTTSSPTTTTSAPTTTTSAPSTTPSSTTTTSAHSTTTSAHTTTTSAPTTATSVPSSSSTSTSRSRATSKETGSSTSMTHTGTTPAPTTTTSATTTHPTSTSRTSTSSTETGRSTSVRHTGTTSSPTTTTSAPTTTTSAPSTTPSSTTTTSAHSTTTSAHTTTTSAPTTATSVPSSSSTSTSRSRATSKETGSSTSMTHTGTTPAPTTTTSATTTHPTSTSRTSTSSTETGRSTSVRHTGTTSSPTTTTSAPTTTTSAPTTTPSSTTTTSAHSTTTSAHTTTTSAPTTATSVPSSSSTSTSRSRATSKETGSSTSMTHTGTTPAPTTTTSATTTHPTSTSRTSTSSTETGRSTSTTHTRTSTSSSPTRSSTPVPITGTTSVPITSTRHPGTQMTRSQPTTSDCQPRCSWTKWFDVDFPAPGVHGGDKETYDNILRSGERICRRPEEITRLQCRAENHPDVSIEQLGQVVQCDPDVGLVCQNRDQDGAGRMCLNYEVRVLCCETPSGCPSTPPLVTSSPMTSSTAPSTLSPSTALVHSSSTQTPNACFCFVAEKLYPAGAVIYHQRDLEGHCYHATCSQDCNVVRRVDSDCPPTTPPAFRTTPPSTSTSEPVTPSGCSNTIPPRKKGETWPMPNCSQATCEGHDTISVHPRQCPEVSEPTCANGYPPLKEVDQDGCCHHYQCQCVCSGWGDPHYITFDGTYYTFLDNCTYVLMQQIVPVFGHLRVLIDNYFCDAEDGLSCPQSIIVEYGHDRVVMTRRPVAGVMTNQVIFNGKVVGPGFEKDGIVISRLGIKMYVTIPKLGVQVMFTGLIFSVEVPFNTFANNTEGQCGTCTNDNKDECRMPGGKVAASCSAMAHHWKVTNPDQPSCNGHSVIPTKPATVSPTDPATTCPPSAICELILSKVFEPCHSTIPPLPFYEGCAFDHCHVSSPDVVCSGLELYASLCAAFDVCIDWRSFTNGTCSFTCQPDKVYLPCGPSNPPYCYGNDSANLLALPEAGPITEGCFCPKSMLLFSTSVEVCVPTGCPRCMGPSGEPVMPGDTVSFECQECTCEGSSMMMICRTKPCPLAPACELSGFVSVPLAPAPGECCPQYTCACNASYCPKPVDCPAGAHLTLLQEEEACCPIQKCRWTQCNVNGTLYEPGAVVSSTLCETCRCELPESPEVFKVTCETQICPTHCPVGYAYQAQGGQCCGQCVQVACVSNSSSGSAHLYSPGESWPDPEERCVTHECERHLDGLVVVTTRKACPPLSCPRDQAQLSEDGCCLFCPPPPSQNTSTCAVHHRLQVIREQGCSSTEPVRLAYCRGNCGDTGSMYSLAANTVEHRCSCCQEVRTSQRKLSLRCADGSHRDFSYTQVEECGCQGQRCPAPADAGHPGPSESPQWSPRPAH